MERTYKIYNTQVSQSVDLEEDEEANCKAYTTEVGETYSDCMSAQLQKYYVKMLGCAAPWFGSSSKTEICQERFGGDLVFEDHYVIDDVNISSVELYLMQYNVTIFCL